jgi:hypothetical protein
VSGQEAQQLAAERLSAYAAAGRAERAAELAQTAAGNPLFIEQLAATLSETSAPADSVLPTTIRGLLAARLVALPAAERSLLLDAAVSGKVFWRRALVRVHPGGESLSELL